MESLDLMANQDGALSERWALLACPWFMHSALQGYSKVNTINSVNSVKPVDTANQLQDHASLQTRLKAPSDCQDLASLVSSLSGVLTESENLNAPECLSFLQRIDAFRRPERLKSWLFVLRTVLEAVQEQEQEPAHGLKHVFEVRHLKLKTLEAAWSLLSTLDTKALTQEALAMGLQGAQVGEWIHQQRLEHLFQSDRFKT
jgi:hypothetical protein